MLKSILKLGPTLSRAEQKVITGGVTHTYNLNDYDVEINADIPGNATCFCDGIEQPCEFHC